MQKAKLFHRIFEARYDRGWRYLDRCGEALLIMEELLPASTGRVWLVDEVTPKGAEFKCPDLDAHVTFGAQIVSVQQNPADVDFDFSRLAADVYATIAARFDIRNPRRFGARSMWILPADSIEEAEELTLKRAPFHDWPLKHPSLQPKSHELLTVLESADGSTGIRFSTKPAYKLDAPMQLDERLKTPPRLLPKGQREALIEQIRRRKQREEHPQAGLLIDIDVYLIDPKSAVGPDEFLANARNEFDRFLAGFQQ